MRLGVIAGIGLGVVMTGCGSPATLPSTAEAPLRLASLGGSPLTAKESTSSVRVRFQNPRTSFSSDKIDLATGKTLPIDDGMGPEGDISFFFDGSRFQVIANAGGGANRALAPVNSDAPFAMAPIPVREGSKILVRLNRGIFQVTVTELKAGSMRFLPSGEGTGSGSVDFSYRLYAR